MMQTGGIASANGRGLGFRVVRELVAMSGGCLNIESQPEVGTSIAMEWYAVKEPAAGRQSVEAAPTIVERETITVFKGDAGWIAC